MALNTHTHTKKKIYIYIYIYIYIRNFYKQKGNVITRNIKIMNRKISLEKAKIDYR